MQYLLVLICTTERCLKTIVRKNISKGVKLIRRRIAENEEQEKKINYKLFNEYFINYRRPSDMYEKLHAKRGEWNEE